MQTKLLLTAIISFIAGGLLVAIAASTFEKPRSHDSMTSMVDTIKDKQGEAYDQAFIEQMIMHHEGAIEMAKFSKDRASHQEIKALSAEIISAQEKEIAQMKQWQKQWQSGASQDHTSH